jgi:hypothetical protein
MASVECLQEAIRMLVAARLALRERNAGHDDLESNRLEVAGRQRRAGRDSLTSSWASTLRSTRASIAILATPRT